MENHATKLHKCLLLAAREIKRICDIEQIPYFIVGGTLLGAVRHKGFIPWDDDLDIGMLRKDYEKFIEVCPKHLNDKFFLMTVDNTPSYGWTFAKLLLKETYINEKYSAPDVRHEIFVDIFPIDRLPQNRAVGFVYKKQMSILVTALRMKCKYQEPFCYSSVQFHIAIKFWSVFPKWVLVGMIKRLQNKYSRGKGPMTVVTGQVGTYVCNYPEETVMNGLIELEFEGELFKAPKYPEKVLSILYGDFMQLPPEEKRVCGHMDGEIDFGPYDNI